MSGTLLTPALAPLRRCCAIAFVALLSAALLPSASGANRTWNAASGEWNVDTNWTPNVLPTRADAAIISNGGTVSVSTGVSGSYGTVMVYFPNTTLNINGGVLSGTSTALGPGAQIVVNSGTWMNYDYVRTGSNSTLTINGGYVSTGTTWISNFYTDTGSAIVTGGTWSAAAIRVAEYGTGTISLNGGYISTANTLIGTSNGTGAATITSGTWNSTGFTISNTGTGSVTLNGGYVTSSTTSLPNGTLNVTSGTWQASTLNFTGTRGVVNVNGGYLSTTNIGMSSSFGTTSGTLTISSGTVNSTDLRITGGTIALNGGRLTTRNAYLGTFNSFGSPAAASVGTALVSSGTWTFDTLTVGNNFRGELGVSGGLVSGTSGVIGVNSSVVGTVTVNGGTLAMTRDLRVGVGGTASMTISDAGRVSAATLSIGNSSGGHGEVSVTGQGSTLLVSSTLTVGSNASDNSLAISDGALVKVGEFGGSTGTIVFSAFSGEDNFIRLDGGYLALGGNRISFFQGLIGDGLIQLWDGSEWVAATLGQVEITFYTNNATAFADTGYNGLAQFTVLTASAIPEPSTYALLGLGALALGYALRRRKRGP